MALYLVALAVAVHLSSGAMFVASLGSIALCAAVGHLVTVLTFGPADLGARGSGFPKHMPRLLVAMVVVKLIAAACIFRRLADIGMITPQASRRWLGVWLAACIVFTTITSYFIELTPTLMAGVVLAVPLVRIAGSPLALYCNRHR